MKSFFMFVCVILAVFAYAQGDKCEIEGRTLKIGEHYSQPGKCEQLKCVGKNEIVGKTCPDVQSRDNCNIRVQDYSKPYPECCPSFEC